MRRRIAAGDYLTLLFVDGDDYIGKMYSSMLGDFIYNCMGIDMLRCVIIKKILKFRTPYGGIKICRHMISRNITVRKAVRKYPHLIT